MLSSSRHHCCFVYNKYFVALFQLLFNSLYDSHCNIQSLVIILTLHSILALMSVLLYFIAHLQNKHLHECWHYRNIYMDKFYLYTYCGNVCVVLHYMAFLCTAHVQHLCTLLCLNSTFHLFCVLSHTYSEFLCAVQNFSALMHSIHFVFQHYKTLQLKYKPKYGMPSLNLCPTFIDF